MTEIESQSRCLLLKFFYEKMNLEIFLLWSVFALISNHSKFTDFCVTESKELR